MRYRALLLSLSIIGTSASAEQMSWLQNDHVRLGVDLERGGAITFLAAVKDGVNVINNFDLGRQVQLSFFSGPVPFEAAGQKPAEQWRHIGWNPIQTGDDFKNTSKVLIHENDGARIHVRCIPMQWPLNNIPGECTFDSWLELDGPTVKVRARITNTRTDHTQYPARFQELPAVYANAPFHRVVSYQGTRPFTDDSITAVTKPHGKHPWSFWTGTEGWAALVNEQDYGLGLITPGRVHFTGGFAGQPGPGDTHSNSTGYLAGQGLEILDHNIVYNFNYELILGSLKDIRARAAQVQPRGLPAWTFKQDRQGWHFQNATDTGWPVDEHIHINLEQDDPQVISPQIFWQASAAPYLVVEAAFHTAQKQATVMWQPLGAENFSAAAMTSFPIATDGQFHRHVIHLADSPSYQGGVIRLRIDPVDHAEPGAWMELKSVRLSASPEP